MTVSREKGGSVTVNLQKVTADWGESTSSSGGGGGATAANGDATWTNAFKGDSSVVNGWRRLLRDCQRQSDR